MAIEHASIADGDRHEPKGISTAVSGTVYVANGSATGTWMPADSHIAAYVEFDSTTPAYSHSTTTSDTPINPVFSVASSKNFSGATSPNARLVYTGTNVVYGLVTFFASMQNADSQTREVELALYKNGTELGGTRVIRTISPSTWGVVAFTTIVQLSTDDYLEIYIKGDLAHTTNFAGAQMAVTCFPG